MQKTPLQLSFLGAALLAVVLLLLAVANADDGSGAEAGDAAGGEDAAASPPAAFEFRLLDAKIPKPLSDHTATPVQLADDDDDDRGIGIYLAGGCDASEGNVYDEEIGEFLCDSISSSMYRFDPSNEQFEQLADMPSPRYRHAAVPIGGRYIWYVGGRDVEDDIVSTVDVYDIETDSWTSFDDLPGKYWASDNTGFPHGNEAWIVGGYNATYTKFSDAVYSIDADASLASGNLTITDRPPLLLGRGDLSSVTDDEESFAIVSGGFGSEDEFCNQAEEVEVYDFDAGTWRNIAPMRNARSDKALVELNGKVLAFGGEQQLRGICDVADKPEVGEATLAVDDVEELEVIPDGANDGFDDAEWEVLADLPEHRFRFAAVALDDRNAVYAFGGQLAYEETCQCYRTSDEVMVYTRNVDGNNVGASAAAPRNGGIVVLLMGLVSAFLLDV